MIMEYLMNYYKYAIWCILMRSGDRRHIADKLTAVRKIQRAKEAKIAIFNTHSHLTLT